MSKIFNGHNFRSVHAKKAEEVALDCTWNALSNDIYMSKVLHS